MLFNFQLRALPDVIPWGASTNQSHLHWFGLTDGWYWLHMDGHNEIFRYSPAISAYWQEKYPENISPLPYVDYYVVRLWEDILAMLADILEPLPPTLARLLETEEQIQRWQQQVKQWEKEQWSDEQPVEDDVLWEAYSQATLWWSQRQLDTGYLTASPRLWFWNNGAYIHCYWDNQGQDIEGIPAWATQRGKIQFTPTQFLEEVHTFNARLLAAMAERIQQVKNSGLRADIAIDIAALEKEQQDRSQWLARRLQQATTRAATPWNDILDAQRLVEKHSRFI